MSATNKNQIYFDKIERAIENIRMGYVGVTNEVIELREKTGIDVFPEMLQYVEHKRDSK